MIRTSQICGRHLRIIESIFYVVLKSKNKKNIVQMSRAHLKENITIYLHNSYLTMDTLLKSKLQTASASSFFCVFFISGGTKGDRELGHHFRQKTLDGGESSSDCVVQLRELPQESFLYLGSTSFL